MPTTMRGSGRIYACTSPPLYSDRAHLTSWSTLSTSSVFQDSELSFTFEHAAVRRVFQEQISNVILRAELRYNSHEHRIWAGIRSSARVTIQITIQPVLHRLVPETASGYLTASHAFTQSCISRRQAYEWSNQLYCWRTTFFAINLRPLVTCVETRHRFPTFDSSCKCGGLFLQHYLEG